MYLWIYLVIFIPSIKASYLHLTYKESSVERVICLKFTKHEETEENHKSDFGRNDALCFMTQSFITDLLADVGVLKECNKSIKSKDNKMIAWNWCWYCWQGGTGGLVTIVDDKFMISHFNVILYRKNVYYTIDWNEMK